MTNVRDRINQYQKQITDLNGGTAPQRPTKEAPKLQIVQAEFKQPQPQRTAGLMPPPAVEQQSIDYRKTKQAWEEASRKIKDPGSYENAFQKLPQSSKITTDIGSGGRPKKIEDVQMPQKESSNAGLQTSTSTEKRQPTVLQLTKRPSRSTEKANSSAQPFDPSRHWTRQSSRFDDDISIESMFLKSQEQHMSPAFQLMYKVLQPMHLGTPIELPDGMGYEPSKEVEQRAKKLINRIFGPKPGEEQVTSRCLPVPAIKMITKLLKAPLPPTIAKLTVNDLVTVKRKLRGNRSNAGTS